MEKSPRVLGQTKFAFKFINCVKKTSSSVYIHHMKLCMKRQGENILCGSRVKAYSPELAEEIALEYKAASAFPAVGPLALHCRVKCTVKIKFLSVILCTLTALLISKYSFPQALRNAATPEVEHSTA